MSEEIKTETENETETIEDFAKLVEDYPSDISGQLNVGDKVSGTIISIGQDNVFLNIGSKIDGVVDKNELLDEQGQLSYNEGDSIELYVVSGNQNEIVLSRALSGVGGMEILEQAYENRLPVQGKVKETCKGGLRVDVMQRSAFCPLSQIDAVYVEDPEEYVGNEYNFIINSLEEKGRNIVLSRRKLLEREQKEKSRIFEQEVEEGDILEGEVVRLMPYGAFVALDSGVEGMVHVSEMSWSRVEKPEDMLQIGDQVRAKVLSMDRNKKKGQLKISLSMKQVSEDPWQSVTERFKAGDKVSGKVTNNMDFGSFVELEPGVEGLVHISELSYTKRVTKPEEVVSIGDTVSVLIKDIDVGKKRISLSLRDTSGDPWLEVPEKYKAGQVVNGLVEKVERFGVFVQLEPGVTGLLPQSKLSKCSDPNFKSKMQEGNTVQVKIEEMQPKDRRITLEPAASGETEDWKQFSSKKEKETAVTNLGAKLQEAMGKQKDRK